MAELISHVLVEQFALIVNVPKKNKLLQQYRDCVVSTATVFQLTDKMQECFKGKMRQLSLPRKLTEVTFKWQKYHLIEQIKSKFCHFE